MINENIKGVRVSEKAFLTLKEASEYFNIGQDKVRQLTDENDCDFVLFNGSKRLIKKKLMEEYLNRQFSIWSKIIYKTRLMRYNNYSVSFIKKGEFLW